MSAIPVVDHDEVLGFVILVHDLSYVQRREAKMQQFLLVAFGSASPTRDFGLCATATGLNMSVDEKRDRMRSMRAFVSEFNVYRWAGRMLVDAARLRSRDRLIGRLTGHLVVAANAAGRSR